MTKHIELNSEQDTIDLAHYIAPLVGPGSVITLYGDLGSGKTFFVKALGAFLGVPDEIDSPSFVIFKEYHCGRFPLYHLDLYRLKHEDELLDLGLLDMLESGITVIEWPQLAEKLLHLTGCNQRIQYKERSQATLVRNRIGSPARASKEIGFDAEIDLDTGLRALIEWRADHKASVESRRAKARAE